MQKTIERQGAKNEPYVRHYPKVIGGVCEYCGILNPNLPATEQYKLCPHYKGIPEIRCSYCDATRDPEDVIYHSKMTITDHPTDPNTLVVVCDNFTCNQKHQARFQK